MMWGYGPGWGPMWGWGWIFPVLMILFFVFFMTRMMRQRGDSALSILRQRYAKGELTKEDFDRMRHDLSA